MSDAYNKDRFLIKSNGSVTKDNIDYAKEYFQGSYYDGKDTKNHVYAENLKDARAKAVKKGLTVKGGK
jgi:hypothetical protein|tara:strand:+ start:33 stop:236 length:204 start_codon:yes stop_codon:yes gene_type:complete